MTDYPRLSTLKTGLACRCPRCGKGPLFKGYLTLQTECPQCGLSYAFADPADGPAFFVMTAVGVVGMILPEADGVITEEHKNKSSKTQDSAGKIHSSGAT